MPASAPSLNNTSDNWLFETNMTPFSKIKKEMFTVALATEHFAGDVVGLFRILTGKAMQFVMAEPGKKYDLLIFTGGADIDPQFYGEENIRSLTDPKRDRIEKVLWDNRVPGQKCFGICRGHQFLNAMAGGILVQHIEPYHPAWHSLTNGWGVNSLHHQGVISLGDGVEEIARSMIDGVVTPEIEITISEKWNFFSVQFHPEFTLPVSNGAFEKMLLEFVFG